jgi:syntaxin 16
LLVASGASSSKGTEGAIALEEDILAAVSIYMRYLNATLTPPQTQTQSQIQPGVDIQLRDRELREIAKSIGSLAELFRDLSSLVIEQGTVLDSIEYNLDNTVVHMEEAVRELDTATRQVCPDLWTHQLTVGLDIKRIQDAGNAFSCSSSLYSV